MTTNTLLTAAEEHRYADLFLHDLNWGAPDHPPLTVELDDGTTLTATNVSSYRGLRVWEVPALPGTKVEAQVDRLIGATTTNRLVVFHDGDRQAWRWPSRTTKGVGVVSRSARHLHRNGAPGTRFVEKLEAIKLPDDSLPDVAEVLFRVRRAFDVETRNESKRASKLMARLYTALEQRYDPNYGQRDHEISVTLARVLFLLFGDDTEMWATELFQELITDHTARDGSDTAPVLNALFEALDTPPSAREGLSAQLVELPYVNGGIFEEIISLPALGQDFRDALLDACAVDWSTISPAIFGSMFQSVRDPQTRHDRGEHYTSEDSILKTLEPLFLDDLRAELEEALGRESSKKRANALNALWDKIGKVRFLDPACGCGNFIIVAYRELRAIELDIMLALQDLSGVAQLSFNPTADLKVTLDHFYGIEIDEWPARIAETAMFLVDRQCDLRLKDRFGLAPERLPIQREATIVVQNALRVDWEEVAPGLDWVFIGGNPPFVGARRRSAEQTADLELVWGGLEGSGDFDYVTGWYRKAIEYLADREGEFALVSTNSICRGQVVPALFEWVYTFGWSIRFAHRGFRWTSEAPGEAHVHCIVVGLSRAAARPKRLFVYAHPDGKPVETHPTVINAYLIDGPNVLVHESARLLSPQLPDCDFGSMANDGRGRQGLIVTPDALAEVEADPIARQYVRPFIQAKRGISGKSLWCLWLVDAPAADLARSPVLRTRVERVRQHRSASPRAATKRLAAQSQLFGERRQPATAYLAIPRHFSAQRPYFTAARYPAEVICGDANFSAADPDGLLFAVISSSMFMAWQRLVGGSIKSDPRFSKEVSWNTFPLPPVPERLRAEIVQAGQRVIDARELRPGLSLEAHYPIEGLAPALQQAHTDLDSRVDEAFGSTPGLADDLERQRLLLICYRDLLIKQS